MDFCDECGSMMKKPDEEWYCPKCSDKPLKSDAETRKAVVLTCPYCQKSRVYCGIDAPLADVRWKQGIENHLRSHDLSDQEQEQNYAEALLEKEVKEVAQSVCERSNEERWSNYDV